MRIGIVRHFRVDYKPKRFMNSSDFEEYVNHYDISPVIINKISSEDIRWKKCYSSDLQRAVTTAGSIYDGDIITTALLREVIMYPVIRTSLKLPGFLWSISSRTAWRLNHRSQKETLSDTAERAEKFIENLNLNSDEDILIVSHGFFLMTLIKKLRDRGFKGTIPCNMKNGYLYILENSFEK